MSFFNPNIKEAVSKDAREMRSKMIFLVEMIIILSVSRAVSALTGL